MKGRLGGKLPPSAFPIDSSGASNTLPWPSFSTQGPGATDRRWQCTLAFDFGASEPSSRRLELDEPELAQ